MTTITYSIPDNKVDEFKAGFLELCPVPKKDGVPIMSEYDWIKQWGKEQFMKIYRLGKQRLVWQTAAIDNDLIE